MYKSKTHFYIYNFCRYFIATMILSYAFAKILGTQFISQPSVYDKPISSLSGFELTWFYYGYSYWYGEFIAGSQIVSSLLLFFRKTTRIGIILFLSIMVNIVILDFAYDIQGAKAMAVTLTVMALFVFFSDFPNFYQYFIVKEPLFKDDERPNWVNKFSKIKFIYIPLVCIGFYVMISTLKDRFMFKNEFYGTWQNENNNSEIDKLNFQFMHTFFVKNKCETKKENSGFYEIKKDSIVLYDIKPEFEDEISNSSLTQIDTSKMILYLKGKYKIKSNSLEIIGDSISYRFKKIR